MKQNEYEETITKLKYQRKLEFFVMFLGLAGLLVCLFLFFSGYPIYLPPIVGILFLVPFYYFLYFLRKDYSLDELAELKIAAEQAGDSATAAFLIARIKHKEYALDLQRLKQSR